jgi:hypothetical protein
MARVAVALTCTAEQRSELMALARSRTEEARLVERAKIVLACLEGKRNDAVGREFGVRPNTVGVWRKRFAAAGLAGLRDRARPGKTAKYGADLRLRVLRQLELPPPKGLVIAEQPPDREIHVILDNLSTHKKNDDWLAAHPNVTFPFTPTSASWLNQVEIWFGIFSRKALAGASFASIAQLVQAIRDFTEAYNRNAAPFVWRKREVKGAQLRNTIVNLRN